MAEMGEMPMGSRYTNETSSVVVAPRDSAAKNPVKAKFKELLAKNSKKEKNYEAVHAMYKTEKKGKPSTAPSSSDEQAIQKKPRVPKFT